MTTTLTSTATQSSRATPSCSNCAIRAHCLSAGLESNDLLKFQDQRAQMKIVHKGQHLFQANAPFEALYIVRSGTIKATFMGSDGTEQISGFYLPGEMVGLDGIENRHYVTTAEALETCSICVFPFTTLMNLAQSIDGLQNRLWRHASHEITTRQRLLMTIGHRSAEGRVAEFLLSISDRFKSFGYSEVHFRLPMSRQDIGAYLGLSVETVCRVLTRFQEAGIIDRDQREIAINDVASLRALSIGSTECPQKPQRRAERTSQNRVGSRVVHAVAAG